MVAMSEPFLHEFLQSLFQQIASVN